jgi:RES domain-containing protein
MPTLVWRLTRAPFRALDGEGAHVAGGRWNSEGRSVVYTSSTLALAALEYLVHVDPTEVPNDLMALGIELPPRISTTRVRVEELPPDWSRVPDHPACLGAGNAWADDVRTVALHVPSALVPEEENVLLNPRHPDAAKLKVVRERRFAFDPRLL